MFRFAAIFSTALAISAGCASDASVMGTDAGGDFLPIEFVAPTVDTITPGAMVLGDTVQIFGSGFLATEYGSTRLRLSGVYQDERGDSQAYDGEMELLVKNGSVASFEFKELIFSPTRDQIGTFSGTATVISELAEAYRSDDVVSILTSAQLPVSLKVEPSIGVVQLRSVSKPGCSTVTEATIGNQDLGFSVRAVGMPAASASEPITFTVSYEAPAMKVTYLKETAYGVWPPHIPSLDQAFVKEVSSGQNHFDAVIVEGDTLVLDPTFQKQEITVSPPVQLGAQTVSKVLLGRFSTGPTNGQPRTVSLLVEASHPNGTTIRRQVSYLVNEEFFVEPYNQNVKLMERSDAVPVSGCFSGGDVGRDLTYTEGSSVTESRSLSFRWDRNIANTLGLTAGVGGLLPVQISANASTTFSETFGIDINETVSSETHVGINFSARIIPGFFGTCYRQVDRIQREVNVVYNNACGRGGIIGQTLLTDWNFGFDIATGPSCDAPSDLDSGGNFEPDGVEYQ